MCWETWPLYSQRGTLFQSKTMLSQETKNFVLPPPTYLSTSLFFTTSFLSLHCTALEQGPYLTMVSPPSCDHDFRVLGWTSFSLLSPPDDGSSSSVSQPSNCLILSLQFPQTTGGTLKCKDTGKKAVILANITRI